MEKKQVAPLRKVVKAIPNPRSPDTLVADLLECGHWLSQATDIYGQRHPDKRRCRYCLKGESAKPLDEQYEKYWRNYYFNPDGTPKL